MLYTTSFERNGSREIDLNVRRVVPSGVAPVNFDPGAVGAAGQKRDALARYVMQKLRVQPVVYTDRERNRIRVGNLGANP